MLYSIALIPISLIPKFLAMAGNVYLYGAIALGLVFLYYGMRIRTDRTRLQARRVLLASVVYLPLLFSLMLFDRPA
jgi:protoheme IX farnesyltransferase